jgi:hypothetical protein
MHALDYPCVQLSARGRLHRAIMAWAAAHSLHQRMACGRQASACSVIGPPQGMRAAMLRAAVAADVDVAGEARNFIHRTVHCTGSPPLNERNWRHCMPHNTQKQGQHHHLDPEAAKPKPPGLLKIPVLALVYCWCGVIGGTGTAGQ